MAPPSERPRLGKAQGWLTAGLAVSRASPKPQASTCFPFLTFLLSRRKWRRQFWPRPPQVTVRTQ